MYLPAPLSNKTSLQTGLLSRWYLMVELSVWPSPIVFAIQRKTETHRGPGSVVSIVSGYGPDGPGDRIPVGRARFSHPPKKAMGSHAAPYTMGTGSFLGVKRPGRGDDHPPPSSAEVKERVQLRLYSTSGPSWPVIGWIYLYLYLLLVWPDIWRFSSYALPSDSQSIMVDYSTRGVWILYADVSEHPVCSIFIGGFSYLPAYEDGTDRMFPNVEI